MDRVTLCLFIGFFILILLCFTLSIINYFSLRKEIKVLERKQKELKIKYHQLFRNIKGYDYEK